MAPPEKSADADKKKVEDGALEPIPDLTLANHKWLLANDELPDKGDAKEKMLAIIKENSMAPYYEEVCQEFGWPVDQALLDSMKEANKSKLEALEKHIKYVIENQGDSELKQALYDKAEFLCKIGDKEAAVTAFRQTEEKTGSIQTRMDIAFSMIRLGMFYNDQEMTQRNIEKADDLLDQGGDWDRRNRLKVYKGTYYISIRKFKEAATLFLETVSTFTSYEMMDYQEFIVLCVLTCLVSLDRPLLKKKVVHGPEIQEVLHQLPDVKELLMAFFECRYAEFFVSLAKIEEVIAKHRLFAQHRRFYVREMRILAYKQLLQSYKSLTLESMAQSFGVTVDFIDRELARFVAAGRLNCKIDKVGGVVETNRPDQKNAQYQNTIKEGDLLLNRIQKLSQIIHL